MRHTHRPCFYLSVAFGIGIGCGHQAFLGWYSWGILSGMFIILSVLNKRLATFLLHVGMVSLGAFYLQSTYIMPSDHIAFLPYQLQKDLQMLEGVIDSDIQIKTTQYGLKKEFELELSRIKYKGSWQFVTGRILVNSFQDAPISYGDQIQLEGRLFKAKSNPTDKFSYQQYLENHHLFFILSVGKNKKLEVLTCNHGHWWQEVSIGIRHRFKEILQQYLPTEEVSMIQAMTLGDKSYMSKDMYALFSQTGTAHILAISGMNMAVIGAMVLFIFKILRIPRRLQFMLTAVFLLAYAFVCGWSASVVRSVLMAAVILSSFCLEFEIDALNSLGVAALIILWLNPVSLFDLGFQLSFLCVLMIVICYPWVHRFIEKMIQGRMYQRIFQAMGISIIASLGVMPLIAYTFGIVSYIGIIANIVIVPLADLIVVLSFSLVSVGLVCPFVASALAGVLKVVLNLMVILTYAFAQIPGGYRYIPHIPSEFVFYYYSGLCLIVGAIVWRECDSKPVKTVYNKG